MGWSLLILVRVADLAYLSRKTLDGCWSGCVSSLSRLLLHALLPGSQRVQLVGHLLLLGFLDLIEAELMQCDGLVLHIDSALSPIEEWPLEVG